MDPQRLTIEKATYKDAQAVLEIRNAAILNQCSNHYPMDTLQAWTSIKLSNEFANSVANNFYLAKYDKQIVGTGMIDIRTGKIDAIFVHPDYIRNGIGKTILKFLEGMALGHGLKNLTLQSTLNATEFYRACGFIGSEVETYTTARGLSLDCIAMMKEIT